MDRLAAEFDAYVRARTPALLRSAYLLTGDQRRAEDLVRDALIRTHRAWGRLHRGNPDLRATVGGTVRTFRKADGGLRWGQFCLMRLVSSAIWL
ncbi:MAG TPA: sigma factor [Candidatus Limnocylindrales bacterium]|nr:sigma factor [Candidatus Limnocylindrales bacterium]